MALEDELGMFCGTEKWYKHFTGLLYTDGVKYLAEKAGAYWLIDLVGSYQPRLRMVPFQIWRVEAHDDRSGLVQMVEDTNMPVLVEQRLPYTDFPLKRFEFYYVDGVMMLKSEY
ncbi:MAG: hypothetical protein HY644_02565 [Acidobacteria bacterium]|nr:hypothetical protein [Acidobacteriota bacterium]